MVFETHRRLLRSPEPKNESMKKAEGRADLWRELTRGVRFIVSAVALKIVFDILIRNINIWNQYIFYALLK